MSNIYKVIKISNLIVNSENYRFEPVGNEDEALKIMLHTHNARIQQLLIDILKYGLNPSDPLMVHDIGGKFVTLEGNRRLTALKIIYNVDILKNIDSKYFAEYSKLLNKSYKNPNIDLTNIPCITYDTPEESDRWVALKHTGSNGGKGTITWGTAEKRIFQDRTSKSTSSATTLVKLMDYIKNSPYYTSTLKQNIDKIKITNLERLIFDPSVRAAVGIDLVKGTIYKLYPDQEIAKPLTKILSDLTNKNFKVAQIYTKDLRLSYTSTFDDKILPDINKKLDKPIDINTMTSNDTSIPIIPDEPEQISLLGNTTHTSPNNANIKPSTSFNTSNDEVEIKDNTSIKSNSINPYDRLQIASDSDKDSPPVPKSTDIGDTNRKNDRERPDINNRKNLISGRTQIRINNPRINQIYRELKRMEIAQYANAVAVLFRVFIEISMDEYIEKNNITTITSDSKLNKKVQGCLEDLKLKKLISQDHVKPVNVSISDKDSILSINTFNSYVHNKHMYPDATQLKNCWNQIEGFMIAIFTNC